MRTEGELFGVELKPSMMKISVRRTDWRILDRRMTKY